MDGKDRQRVVSAIWLYENSVERPEAQRLTFTDEDGRIQIKAGNENFAAYREYANKCEEYLRFGDDVDQATCGAFGDHYEFLKICDTPQIFLDAGFEQKPMLYTQHHLEDAIHPKSDENDHWHGLSIQQVKKFPELLANPVLLCDSPARNDVMLAVMLEVDCDKLPIIACIKPKGMGVYELQRIETNIILSIYGKNEFAHYFSERVKPDKIVYYNKERGQELERLSGIQFPGCYSNLSHDHIIRRPQCLVNIPRSEPEKNLTNEHADLEHVGDEMADSRDAQGGDTPGSGTAHML